MTSLYPAVVLTDPSTPGGNADVTLRQVPLASGGRTEAWLRDFLLAHPSALPTTAIDPAYADVVPICRELRTPAGPLDCLFATKFGGLVVVECKLWRNPQARREVVGQILDYAKELAGWEYGDLQREVSVARGERATDALFAAVQAKHPDVDQVGFVDAVSRNLSRGRFMLLVAGDGIREGTESIVQYVSRHAGLQLTFGLVEVAGYEMPDGRLLVQPRILARTVDVERAVVRIDGPGAHLGEVLTPEEAVATGATTAISPAVAENNETEVRRSFDPAVLDADRRWRGEFVRRVRFDDPAQGVGRVGYGRVYLDLPVPWAWMTAYSARGANQVGNTLTLKGSSGRELFDSLEVQRAEIEAELVRSELPPIVYWRSRGDLCWVEAARRFPGDWTVGQEAEELDWLLTASNTFVNVLRPRLMRLLPRQGSD